MNTKSAVEFINSLVRNLQVLCHSNVDFSDNVEVIGHIYLSVDKCKKFNYIVNEKVCKNDDSSTVFVSNSFHAEQKEKSELEQKSLSTKSKHSMGSEDKQRLNTVHKPSNIQSRRMPHFENRPSNKIDRVRHAPRDGEPFKKIRKIELEEPEVVFDVVKEEPEISFTAEPVFFQPSTSMDNSDMGKGDSDRFVMGESGDYADYSDTSLNQVDLTSVKEEPIDVYSENSRGVDNILNQVEMQHSQFDQAHRTGMENLQHLSNNLSSYNSEIPSLSPTEQQQQQILSLFTNRSMKPRIVLPLEDKVKLIKQYDCKKPSQHELARMFGISQRSVCNILKVFTSKRRVLTLDEKVQVIRESESALKPSQMFMSTRRAHKILSLEDKVKVIHESESSSKPSQSKLAEKFGISQMTVCNILKMKGKILFDWRNMTR